MHAYTLNKVLYIRIHVCMKIDCLFGSVLVICVVMPVVTFCLSLEPPQMIISPSQSPHRITVGTQQLLYCAAEGLPTPTVQWLSNGVPLHPLQQPYQQLYLVPTDAPHTTVYTCMGRNHIRGVDHVAQANVTVIVESKQV